MSESNPYQSPITITETEPTPPQSDEPSGLGGWLILVCIGVVVTPIRLVMFLFQVYLPIFQNGAWENLTTPGSPQYSPLWAPLLIGEIIGNSGFAIAYTVLAFLLFQKSRWFPKVYIALAIINLLFIFVDTLFASMVLPDGVSDPEFGVEIVRTLISCAIWIPYMLMSKRVKNTFVE